MDNKDKIKIEQYKIFVESAEKTSDKRIQSNSFFLSINTVILAVFTFLSKDWSYRLEDAFGYLCVFGIIINFIWFLNIRSYRLLNSEKFKIINIMEKDFPYKPFTKEWNGLHNRKGIKKYFGLTKTEVYLPFIIIILFIFILIYLNY